MLAKRDPTGLLERTRHRVDRTLDPDAFLESDGGRVFAKDAADQLAAFDGLEIVEAEFMAGRRNEAVVGLVVRRGENCAEA